LPPALSKREVSAKLSGVGGSDGGGGEGGGGVGGGGVGGGGVGGGGMGGGEGGGGEGAVNDCMATMGVETAVTEMPRSEDSVAAGVASM
jgi:hypothetical protein